MDKRHFRPIGQGVYPELHLFMTWNKMGLQQVAVKKDMLLWKKTPVRGSENKEGSDFSKKAVLWYFLGNIQNTP